MTMVAFSTPGFAEFAVLGVLALLIFGPDRLPDMARNAGQMIAKFKREASVTLDELKRAADLDELRGVADELRGVGSELRSSGTDLQRVGSDLNRSLSLSPGPDEAATSPASGPGDTGAPFDGAPFDEASFDEAPFDPDAT